MKKRKAFLFMMAVLMIMLLASAAHADSIDVSLVQTSQTAAPGSTVEFGATVTNLSTSDTVYLNGDGSVTTSPFLTVDDSPYLNNFPLFLDPSEVSGPFALFDVIIDPSAAPGTYDFNSFTITGGLNSSASDTLGAATFSVTVSSRSSVPEPSSLILIASTLIIALIIFVAIAFRSHLSAACSRRVLWFS
jgi:hypothetical protein